MTVIEPNIGEIAWIYEENVINEIKFGTTVSLIIETQDIPDGEELEVIIEPKQFVPTTKYNESKYISRYTISVNGNKATLDKIPIKMHWPIIAHVKNKTYKLNKVSKELKTQYNSNGCGFQYLTYNSANSEMPISRTVEIDVHIVVTEHPDDYLNYNKKDGHLRRLSEYLEWGFNQKHSNRYLKNNPGEDSAKFRDEDGVPIYFKFNMLEYIITEKITSVSEFNQRYGPKINTFRLNQEKTGKYGGKYNQCVFAARLKAGMGMQGGTAGSYGGGAMILLQGEHNLSSERLDKNIIHEIIHAFYGYNDDLFMGNSERKHADRSIGGTGALAYGGSSQERANTVNIHKIIETLPYEDDYQIT